MVEVKVFYNDPNMPDNMLLRLLHSAFEERVEQGINFGCATYTMEEYKNETKNAYLFVAYDDETPIGSITIKVKKKINFCYGSQKYVATVNGSKRKGIGTLLSNTVLKFAKDNNYLFVVSATATNAESSVNWHKKNGYIPFFYKKFRERNYSSIVFLNPISPLFRVVFKLFRLPILYISKLYISLV